MKRHVGTALIVFLFAGWMSAQSPASTQSHEESLVRETYARASFAGQVSVLAHSAILHDPSWPSINDQARLSKELAKQIKFELTHVRVGELSEIGSVKWRSLLTTFPEKTIQINYQDLPFKMQGEHETIIKNIAFADAWWSETPLMRGGSEADPTAAEAVAAMKKPGGGNGRDSRRLQFRQPCRVAPLPIKRWLSSATTKRAKR